jgi:hypothetical protein
LPSYHTLVTEIKETDHGLGSSPVIPQEMIVGRAIKPAEETFDLLAMWIRDCNEHHSLCRFPAGRLPTRVIDVGETGIREPSLKVTNGEFGYYTALSHCWGSDPVIRTTRETLVQHQYQLPMC